MTYTTEATNSTGFRVPALTYLPATYISNSSTTSTEPVVGRGYLNALYTPTSSAITVHDMRLAWDYPTIIYDTYITYDTRVDTGNTYGRIGAMPDLTTDTYPGTTNTYELGWGLQGLRWDTIAFTGWEEPSKKDKLRKTLRANLVRPVKSRAASIDRTFLDRERIALDTLRELVTEEEYRKYLKYGFLTVTGASGDRYQIFRDASHTKVWRRGILVEEVCIKIVDPKVPSTDKILALKAMIEADEEEEFKKAGNRYRMRVLA